MHDEIETEIKKSICNAKTKKDYLLFFFSPLSFSIGLICLVFDFTINLPRPN